MKFYIYLFIIFAALSSILGNPDIIISTFFICSVMCLIADKILEKL